MWKKRGFVCILVLCTALLFIGVLPVSGEEEVYDAVLRLHVLANSDSEEDQALKLKVRDAVLEAASPYLKGVTDREQAAAVLMENEDIWICEAEKVIAAQGYDYPVSVTLTEEEYPRRDYDSVCFPAGKYLSLRIIIGSGEGENWWCCLFPRLCLASATVSSSYAEDACIEVGLTPDQYKIITETDKPVYQVRFKLLELLGKK